MIFLGKRALEHLDDGDLYACDGSGVKRGVEEGLWGIKK